MDPFDEVFGSRSSSPDRGDHGGELPAEVRIYCTITML